MGSFPKSPHHLKALLKNPGDHNVKSLYPTSLSHLSCPIQSHCLMRHCAELDLLSDCAVFPGHTQKANQTFCSKIPQT